MLRDQLTYMAAAGVPTALNPNFYIQEECNSTFMPGFTEKGKRENLPYKHTAMQFKV